MSCRPVRSQLHCASCSYCNARVPLALHTRRYGSSLAEIPAVSHFFAFSRSQVAGVSRPTSTHWTALPM